MQYVDATSLFGERTIISCVQFGDKAESKEVLVSLLPLLAESENIFIIDEPFADANLVTRLTKVSKKLYNAKEEKAKDASVFALCDSFAKRDKKTAWVDLMTLKEKGESEEAIQGALWWKFQVLWKGVLEGKRSAFTQNECEVIGRDIMRASILAHRGERDLMVELERIILSL